MATHFHSTLPLVDESESTGVVSDALDTTGLMTLASGQGAKVTNRENASDAAERARQSKERRHEQRRLTGANRPTYARHEQKKAQISIPQIAGLAVAGIAVVAALLFVVSRCANSVAENPSALSFVTSSNTLEATTGLTLNYDGASYEFRDDGGSWKLVSPSAGDAVLIDFEGTPVYLVIHDDVIYVPENLSNDTWDVMACLVAEGAVAVKLPDASGEGTIASVRVDGSSLVLTLESQENVEIPLG